MQEIIILHPILQDRMNAVFQRIKCLSDFLDEVGTKQHFIDEEDGYCQLFYILKTGFYLRHCIFVSPRGYRCRASIHHGPQDLSKNAPGCIESLNEMMMNGSFELDKRQGVLHFWTNFEPEMPYNKENQTYYFDSLYEMIYYSHFLCDEEYRAELNACFDIDAGDDYDIDVGDDYCAD